MRMNNVMSAVTVRRFVILAAIAALSATSVLTGCSQRARIGKAVVEDSTGKKGTGGSTGAPTPAPSPTPSSTPPPAEVHLYGENGAQLLADLELARVGLETSLNDMEEAVHLGSVKVAGTTEDLVRSALNVSDVTRLESTLNAYCTVFRGDSNAVPPVDTAIDKEKAEHRFCTKASPIDAENSTCKGLKTITEMYKATFKELKALHADMIKAPAFAQIDNLSSAGKLEGAPGIDKLKGEVAYHKNLMGAADQMTQAAQKLVELAKSINCDL